MDTSKMVFVFGSNTAGIHGAGAAKYARLHKDAKLGSWFGRTGDSWAIPTKGHLTDFRGKLLVGGTLPLEQIQQYVHAFLAYAKQTPEIEYQITCIGCGLAGLRHQDIAPMFKDAPDNCYFDNKWFPYLTSGAGDHPQHKFWGEG